MEQKLRSRKRLILDFIYEMFIEKGAKFNVERISFLINAAKITVFPHGKK